MDKQELQALLTEWQKRLRLQDWDVQVKISRMRDMKFEGHCGEVHWQLSAKQAIISVVDPIDYPPDLAEPQDMEKTLIHELLHLHFAMFDEETDTPQGVAQEQAIICISQALVGLKREKERRDESESS